MQQGSWGWHLWGMRWVRGMAAPQLAGPPSGSGSVGWPEVRLLGGCLGRCASLAPLFCVLGEQTDPSPAPPARPSPRGVSTAGGASRPLLPAVRLAGLTGPLTRRSGLWASGTRGQEKVRDWRSEVPEKGPAGSPCLVLRGSLGQHCLLLPVAGRVGRGGSPPGPQSGVWGVHAAQREAQAERRGCGGSGGAGERLQPG